LNFLVVDIETTGLDWKRDRIHGVAMCWGSGPEQSEYYAVNKDLFEEFVNGYDKLGLPVVGHNVRFDLKFLSAAGFSIPNDVHDTRILAHLLDENNGTGLKELVPRYLGEGRLSDKAALDAACGRAGVRNIAELCALDLDGNEQFPPGSFTDIIARYAIEDAKNTYDLFLVLSEAVSKDEGLANYYIEEAQPFERILLNMELRGMAVDTQVLDNFGAELRQRQAELETEMTAVAATEINTIEEELYEKAKGKRKSTKGKESVRRRDGKFNTVFLFSSSGHIGSLVYERLGAAHRTTAKGNWDTSEATLQSLKDVASEKLKAFLDLFFEWRSVQKNLSTYVDGYKEHIRDGRIHASYNQFQTTGRLASSAPNVQNIPRGSVVKRAFKPAPGKVFVYFDYSQIELRIAAHLSQDENMLSWFQRNMDPHQDTADLLGITRQAAKRLNFLFIYDGKQGRLHESFLQDGITDYSLDDCKQILSNLWARLPGYKQYLNGQLQEVRSNGGLVSSTGRVRRLPDIEYGDCLDWRTRSFRGNGRLVEGLRAYPGEYLSPETMFERASIRYSHAKKQAYNFPVQHMGAHIMKCALMGLAAAGYDIVTTVHDSGIVELSLDRLGELDRIRDIVETAAVLSIPLKADLKLLASLDEKDLISESNSPILLPKHA
jgi:DNA polymerase I